MESQSPLVLVIAAFSLDLLFGDPISRWHPIALFGALAARFEVFLFALTRHRRSAGVVHLVLLLALALGLWWGIGCFLAMLHPLAAWCFDLVIASRLLCLRGLVDQGNRVKRDLHDLNRARGHMHWLVGRDTTPLERDGLVRATIESLAENLTDGVLTPLWALCLLGLPGLILVKVVSTLDSMVGYRNERYEHFGWAAARCDDMLHWLPARLSVATIMLAAALLRGSPGNAWRCALRYHSMLPSPNSGWSEAAYAGALRVRLLGPVWYAGKLVNTAYMGESSWPADLDETHLERALRLTLVSGGIALLVGLGLRAVMAFSGG